MFIRDSRRSYRTYSYPELILINDLCSFGTLVGVTELILIQRYLYLSQISRRSLQNLYLYYGVYTCSEVPVGITEITERVLVLRNLFLYGSTCKYYKTYTGTSYLILVLRSISWSYVTYTCIIELILVFQILYWYYGTYTCISDLIHVLQNLYLSYGTYIGLTEHILILQILFLCEGTRRYNKSKLIVIVSHTRSDQTYADTYQVWTLVHSRYRS